MKHLYAPWREEYSKSIDESKKENTPQDACVFCAVFQSSHDAQHFILRRFPSMIVMLNRYPYNAGHIMILPIAHVASLNSLNKESRLELIELTNACVEIVKAEFACDGVNVGINIGKAAGAGIPSHLHMHILPRFFGDTNFLPTLADTKQISFDLNTIYTRLKPHFDALML
jgi:ATP adenylyltransferase